jgi:hypothetical protein
MVVDGPFADGRFGTKRRGIGSFYVLTLTFASIDWMMSLEPHWYSTIYGLMVNDRTGSVGFCFAICVLAWLRAPQKLHEEFPVKPFWDLGNMLLAFVMLWAYFLSLNTS